MLSNTQRIAVSQAQEEELSRFELEVAALQHGERDPDEFKRFRLENGVYGIRGTTDQHMIRIKVRFGALTPEQLECLAAVTEQYTPLQLAHITTRQDLQIHNVEQRQVVTVLRRIAESGLTTREACGNTVRNVTCCPLAGVAADEAFDVTPYADVLSAHFLRHPVCQNLPRKFKFAFEGCPTDHARIGIHDLGFVARRRSRPGGGEECGFQIFVGGGLGPIPFSAQLLEEFTPVEQMLPSAEAVLRLFDRHGNRQDRARARLKFVIREWGVEKFRQAWQAERRAVIGTRSGLADWRVPVVEETAPALPEIAGAPTPQLPAYLRWRLTNCLAQKQPGYWAVRIRCLLGDITHVQLRAVAAVARRYCGGRIRTTITQNLLLRWVPETHLANVYAELAAQGLAQSEADQIADITRCPGADTCQIAITHSRGLAQALGELFADGLAREPALQRLSIKISGCPNSCGQHHIADLGFFGNSKTVDGHAVAHYRLMLGGRTEGGRAEFGVPVVSLPAKRVPDAVQKLLLHYRDQRGQEESFHDYVHRVGLVHLKQLLDEFTTLPPYSEHPEMYGDLGFAGEFKVEIGKGECAA